ncbi:MAG: hypothetical protein AAGI38_20050 [Bacteroidota bacterium]
MNWVARSVESCLVIGLTAHYYYLTALQLKVERLERTPMFWIATGLLLYFASTFMIMISNNYLVSRNLELVWWVMWGIHAFFGILKNVFFTLALWTRPTESTS